MERQHTILLVFILCAACAGPSLLPTPATPSPSPSPVPSPTPSPTPEPISLTVCLPEEPESLYLYGAESEAAHHVWHALYDGPTDHLGYRQQPVILTEIPLLGDSATVHTTTVETGDRVLAASGSVMRLSPGVIVRDAEGQRITFRGQPIIMSRMVVTFTLRSDIQWADGKFLTAGDSIYAFQLAADPATPTNTYLVERTAAYRAVGEHQVVWQGVPGFLDRGYALNLWHPLPRHAWEPLSAAELLTAEVSTRQPLGWGPFALREWRPGDSITLERNPFYFRASEGLPRVDEITFRFITDPERLAQQLLAGTCDVVTHEASADLNLDDLGASPEVKAVTTYESSWELLAFGISPAAGYERPDFFEDVRVRQGLAQCIDREALAKQASPLDGRVLHSYLPPDHPVYGPNVQPPEELFRWPYDAEAGQRLLAQAGWYDEDGDGIREAHGVAGIADGTPYQVTYNTTDEPLRLRTATLVQGYLASCGIAVTLQTEPADRLFAAGPEGDIFGRRFDLAQFSWQITTEPLCDAFLSSQIPDQGHWGRPNVAGFIDSTYDAACQAALATLPGSSDYVIKHAVPQRLFSERLPVLPLFQRRKTTLARVSVTGLSPNPSEPSELWNLEQIGVER